MKEIKLFHIFIFLIILASCNSKNKNDVVLMTREHNLKNLTEVSIEVFKINPKFYPILDSIVEITVNCTENEHEQIGFVVSTFQDEKIKGFDISNIIDLNFHYYKYYDGLFYYKGYIFLLIGKFDSYIVTKINRKAILYSIKPEVFPYVYENYFSNSMWTYLLQNNNYECMSITHCGDVIKYLPDSIIEQMEKNSLKN